MDNGHLVRYCAPTKLDQAEFGQIWAHLSDDGPIYYIQTNRDENSPHWLRMGYFFEQVFKEHIQQEEFIASCLEKFK